MSPSDSLAIIHRHLHQKARGNFNVQKKPEHIAGGGEQCARAPAGALYRRAAGRFGGEHSVIDPSSVVRESNGIAIKQTAKYDNELLTVDGKWLIKDVHIVFGQ